MATDTENTGKVTTYLYDDLGRLTNEAITGTQNNSTLTYTYDDRGNRLTQSRGNATVTYTYDLNNRLTSHTASGVVTIYNYDNNGNTISTYVGGNFAGGYAYDLFNRQKTYTPDGSVYTTTTYRPDGLRHSIGTTKHIWDAGNIVGDITGSTYKQYFRALNLIYSIIGTTTQYYRYNGHGDVVALTNATGTVTKTYTYNAFGEEQNIDATDANPFRYCGEYYDKVSGTLYLRARNYNASIGRFTQEDPIERISNSSVNDIELLCSEQKNSYSFENSNIFSKQTISYTLACEQYLLTQKEKQQNATKNSVKNLLSQCNHLLPYSISKSINGGEFPNYVEIEASNDPNPNYNRDANCYSYAIGTYDRGKRYRGANPGWYTEYITHELPRDVDSIAYLITYDLQALGRNGRIISSFDSPIYSNEYRIAVRVTTDYDDEYLFPEKEGGERILVNTTWDYHVMVQVGIDQWAEKRGLTGGTVLYNVNDPSTLDWVSDDGYIYDSKIVYIAVTH